MKFKVVFFVLFTLSLTISIIAQEPTHSPKDCEKLKSSLPAFENDVVKEINSARTEPKAYQGKIEGQKKFLRGKILRIPKQTLVLTFEGAASMNEAIDDLGKVTSLKPLAYSEGLTNAAKQQLKDLLENPDLGHAGKDGSSFGKRLAKFGDTGKAGENITYQDKTAELVVLRMLIDDGVESRTHRKNILNEAYKHIGVACGPGKVKGTGYICVAIFAERFIKNDPNKPKAFEIK